MFLLIVFHIYESNKDYKFGCRSVKVQMTLKFLLFYLKVLEKPGALPFTVS